MGRSLYFPFQVGDLGTPRTAGRALAIRHQIEQLLFTLPGERVRRPSFGCGVQRMVFAGASQELAAAAEYTIRVALRTYLGDEIRVDAVRVGARDATITIDILYTLLATGEEQAETFVRPIMGPA
ncbi:GPW/gp25 family protein [Sorangium sp. So ce341]|uniref:GPW/gp25 family protein n=1 Tax=Sorangium sp. So ce341 TaxID=3133302 RepID=UPI003F606E32